MRVREEKRPFPAGPRARAVTAPETRPKTSPATSARKRAAEPVLIEGTPLTD
jgi:hypothetical protein